MNKVFPPVIRIEPASSCNLRCQHCPTGLDASPKGLLSKDLFLKLLPEIHQNISYISTVVLYHGGEPLLNPEIFFFINELKKIGIKKVKLVTNGKLLSEEICSNLLNSNLDEIEISLDGLSTEDSNAIRRRSNAREIIEKVLRLNELKNQIENSIRITISTTQFIDDYKIDFKQISNAPVPFWLNEYKKLGINIKSNWAVQWPGGYPKSSKVIYHDLNVELPDKCSLLDETFTIRSNGDVVVCCYDLTSLKVIGNVSETTISSIINSTEYLQFKNNFSNKIYSEPCKSCAVVTGKKYLGKSLLLDIV